jgi:hypothetical protein
MPITITLGEIANSQAAWLKLIAADLPTKPAYWVGKKYRKVEPEIIDYQKKHDDLVRKYGKPSEIEPGKIEVTRENVEVFQKEIGELRSIEITLDFDPIKLADIEQAKLIGRDFALLGKFVEE